MEAILILAWLASAIVTVGMICAGIGAAIRWLVSPGRGERRPMAERREPRLR
jgi:hypothetical protein